MNNITRCPQWLVYDGPKESLEIAVAYAKKLHLDTCRYVGRLKNKEIFSLYSLDAWFSGRPLLLCVNHSDVYIPRKMNEIVKFLNDAR